MGEEGDDGCLKFCNMDFDLLQLPQTGKEGTINNVDLGSFFCRKNSILNLSKEQELIMTIQAIKTNGTTYLKKGGGGGVFCLLCLFTLLCGMSVWGETVMLTADDMYGASSLWQYGRWSLQERPSAANDYVVTGVSGKNTLRTPPQSSTEFSNLQDFYREANPAGIGTFGGGSLTIQDGGILLLKHQNNTRVTIPVLNLEGGGSIKEANGQDNGFLSGTINIRGTAEKPSLFVGSCENYTYRWIKVDGSLAGDKTAVIQIATSTDTSSGHARAFHVELHGDNANYQGRFLVLGCTYHGVELAAKHANALGAGDPSETEPVLSLIAGGDKRFLTTFWGMDGYRFSNENYTLKIDGDVRIGGRTANDDGVGLYFDGGAKIAGIGSLVVKSYGDTGAAVVMNRVAIDASVTHITVTNDSALVLGEGYSNAQPVFIAKGSVLTIACPALTVVENGALVTTGEITKDATDKIRVVCDLVKLCEMSPGATVNVLSAPNLGTVGGLTLDDFVFDVSWATEFSTAFSIVDKKLIFTRPAKSVMFKNSGTTVGLDTTQWDPSGKPVAGSLYAVMGDGIYLRSKNKKNETFAGDALIVADKGQLRIDGGVLTFNDLRMGAGGAVWPIRSHEEMTDVSPMNNALAGEGAVYAPKSDPFQILFSGGNSGQTKSMWMDMKLSGAGDLAIVKGTSAKNAYSWVYFENDNSGFTGGITVDLQVSGKTLGVDFANEAAMGGPVADGTFRADRLKLVGNATFRCSRSYDMTDATRGITIENGVTFHVQDGKTLNIGNRMTGNGLITKTGTGMLGLGGDNTLTGTDRVWVQGGGLALSHKNALSKRPVDLGLKNTIVKTTLRIETEDGVMIKAGADDAFKLKRTEAVGSNIEPNAIPDLEVAGLENLKGASKEVTLFRYENAESLEDHDAFKAKFNLVFPSSGNYKVAWGTKEIVAGKEYAVTLTVKPTGFVILVR